MKPGDKVYVVEDGAVLPGLATYCYTAKRLEGGRPRIVVQLDDPERSCPVDCFASSVFATRKEAEAAAR